jgi:hypothetical protein
MARLDAGALRTERLHHGYFALGPFCRLHTGAVGRRRGATTECQVAEPTRDFNVMTRRGVCAATVNVCTGSETLAPPGDSIIYVISRPSFSRPPPSFEWGRRVEPPSSASKP